MPNLFGESGKATYRAPGLYHTTRQKHLPTVICQTSSNSLMRKRWSRMPSAKSVWFDKRRTARYRPSFPITQRPQLWAFIGISMRLLQT